MNVEPRSGAEMHTLRFNYLVDKIHSPKSATNFLNNRYLSGNLLVKPFVE